MRVWLPVTVALLTAGCASLDRAPRATLALGGFHKEVVETSFSTLRHQSQGLAVDFEHEDGEGPFFSLHVSHHHSEVSPSVSAFTDRAFPRVPGAAERPARSPVPDDRAASPPYWLTSVGLGWGYFMRHYGGALGFHLVHGPTGALDANLTEAATSFPVPWVEIRAGDLESGWAVLRLGPRWGLDDGLLAFFGGAFQGDSLSGSLGVGVIGNFFFREDASEIQIDGGSMGGHASIRWVAETGWGIDVRTTLGESYGVEIALTFDFEKFRDESLSR